MTTITMTPAEYYGQAPCITCGKEYQVDPNLNVFAGTVKCGCGKKSIDAGTIYKVHEECGGRIVSLSKCNCADAHKSGHIHLWNSKCENGHSLPYTT